MKKKSFPLGLFLIVRRSLTQHLLSTLITSFSIALGVGLLMALFSLNRQTYQAFTGGNAGFDAVLGARGSPLQLVLNTVFHLETSPGNIPWSLYQEMQQHPMIELAIPYALGDNYQGFRMVGTTPELFTRFEYRQGQKFQIQDGGRFFDERRQEAVIGSYVAQKTGLKVGSEITPYHGLSFDEDSAHHEHYLVTGILKSTNSPSDHVIWIPIEGIFRLGGHVLQGSGKEIYVPKKNEKIPDIHKEVSAVMLKFKSPEAGFLLSQKINKQGVIATLAWPISGTMAEFFERMGWVHLVLEGIAYLMILVASASILSSLYNTMNERKREFAILRTLGAKRRTLFSLLILEATSIAFIGIFLGYLFYVLLLSGIGFFLQTRIGIFLDLTAFHPILILAPLGTLALGAISGIIPAWKAYQTDVASLITPTS